MKPSIKIAILDLNNGQENQGIKSIIKILDQYQNNNQVKLESVVFDIRQEINLPDLSFDGYISSGGPGSPLESENSEWDSQYIEFLNKIEAFNKQDPKPKPVFLICHSFQMYCRAKKIGIISKRNSTSFGLYPCHAVNKINDEIFAFLPKIFYVIDSRKWQVTAIKTEDEIEKKVAVLAIEKERDHVPLERCIMAIKFNAHFWGTQFHPEADPIEFKKYVLAQSNVNKIISYSTEKNYIKLVNNLTDIELVKNTQLTILPKFIHYILKIKNG